MFRCMCLFLAVSLLLGGCGAVTANAGIQETAKVGEQVTRCLVLGRDRAAGLTDSMMLVCLGESGRSVRILQIPRDTYAAYTDRDYKKLNGALSRLGLGGLKSFLSEALGVPLDYAISLDLEAVAELVDAVGGVDVEILQEMRYVDSAQGLDIDFQPGMRHLDGREAELFLRYRSGYADADLGRMDAQKRFLQAFTEKCSHADAGELVVATLKILPHVQTDLPIGEAIRLVRLLSAGDVTEFTAVTAPGEAVQGNSGAWYYSLNRAGMIRVINGILLPSPLIGEEQFDRARIFDRVENPHFHNVYIAPDGG